MCGDPSIVSQCSCHSEHCLTDCCHRLCFPTPSSTLASAILQYGQEAVLYLKIPFENSLIHAVFDPHPRSDHPSGPSFSISRKPIDIHALKIFASPISDETFACRIQRISNRVAGLEESLKSAHRKENEDALRKPASSRTSWTLVESSLLVHRNDTVCCLGIDMPTANSGFIFENPQENVTPETAAVPVESCGPLEVSSKV